MMYPILLLAFLVPEACYMKPKLLIIDTKCTVFILQVHVHQVCIIILICHMLLFRNQSLTRATKTKEAVAVVAVVAVVTAAIAAVAVAAAVAAVAAVAVAVAIHVVYVVKVQLKRNGK